MGRKKTDLKQRILAHANRLFYYQGYTNTGINQIVQEAGTNKPGLYSYFEGKDDLARQYLENRHRNILDQVIAYEEASDSVEDFFRRWMLGVKEMVQSGTYNGCAVANFASQTDTREAEMRAFVTKLGRRWHTRLVAYLRAEIRSGRFQSHLSADALARQMLVANEGAIAMWKITGEARYFDEGIKMFEGSLGAPPSE